MCRKMVSAIMSIWWQQSWSASTQRFRRSGGPKPAPSRGGQSAECHNLPQGASVGDALPERRCEKKTGLAIARCPRPSSWTPSISFAPCSRWLTHSEPKSSRQDHCPWLTKLAARWRPLTASFEGLSRSIVEPRKPRRPGTNHCLINHRWASRGGKTLRRQSGRKRLPRQAPAIL